MLQQMLREDLSKWAIINKELPDYLENSLSASRKMRPYQEECLKYFLSYMDDYRDRPKRPHLLFHMATGSGKTLIMAATMLYLYEKGYRNFLFFVDTNNIVEKTKDNFLNRSSSKYLFAPQIVINGKNVEIRQVENFQSSSSDCINLCLTTIQGLHSALNSNKENALTYEDFSDQPVVMISDEAHHMNSETKNKLTKEEEKDKKSWEATEREIFKCDNGKLPNVLLEFTATADLDDPNIAKKYEDKIIFDYPLKKFREDLYSKEVMDIVSDLSPIDRAIQAIILSQYKRKLFAKIRENIKPVVMFKSKTIADNKAFYDEFIDSINNLEKDKIEKIKGGAHDSMKAAFDYLDKNGVSLENLILELKEEFSEERLLLVDGKNISPEKQQLLNSLEEHKNGIRAVFAVDMLNEGWDVLNLFDIVRLYNTRDAKDGKPGKTTMQEAQLIGRGARYMPFVDPNNTSLPTGMRKYDGDAGNQLRDIETLHYHCENNPRYIQELHSALVKTGIKAPEYVQQSLFIKDDFKEKDIYKHGLVFMNERVPLAIIENDGTIGKAIKDKTYKVMMPTGKMKSGFLFGDNAPSAVQASASAGCRFIELGEHVIRAAINYFPSFYFDSLKRLYPSLKSVKEFITSKDYLRMLNVIVFGKETQVEAYSQKDKLYIAKEVLRQIEPLLTLRGKSYRGSREFKPSMIKDVFSSQKTLNFAKQGPSSNQEFGLSMKESRRTELRADLMYSDWYAYNDCYGTSEEKALVKYIESISEKLLQKYESFYLFRNERDVRIFSFDNGNAFEPDFVLFLRRKGSTDVYDNIQIFIEPKGENLRKEDKWKEDFLMELKENAEVRWLTKTDSYNVWGVPFFTEDKSDDFHNAFDKEILMPPFYLPLYPFHIACGILESGGALAEDGVERWIDVSSCGFKPNENMFVVHAKGDSMMPKIHNGDLCVFERYTGGSREGEIVLAQVSGKDDDYLCRYTIKKYHSEKTVSDDSWEHRKIELLPINTDGYSPIAIDDDGCYQVLGVLRHVISD